ncbi:MAG: hypothetical protein FWE05_11795 [Defluviitaleaceae bacterium]|nr:hypothetical protein [Defluviitaleaceae bacterium]
MPKQTINGNCLICGKTTGCCRSSMPFTEVLIDGQRGVEGEHFNLNHVAIVENGEIVRREFF